MKVTALDLYIHKKYYRNSIVAPQTISIIIILMNQSHRRLLVVARDVAVSSLINCVLL